MQPLGTDYEHSNLYEIDQIQPSESAKIQLVMPEIVDVGVAVPFDVIKISIPRKIKPVSHEVEAVWPLKHPPMVFSTKQGPKLDPIIKQMVPRLALFNDMSYALGRRQKGKWERYKKYFEKEGWSIKALPGVTGKNEEESLDDIPAILAYKKEQNMMVITFRGSQSLPGEMLFGAKDWQTNLSRETTSTSDENCALHSKLPPDVVVHKGYAFRTAETLPIIENYLKVYWNINKENGEEQRNKDMKFILTGHSQGSALGTLALAGLVHGIGKEFYGKDFNNSESNKFAGYFFSTPRSFARMHSAQVVQDLVGKHNIVSQNVEGDPVPHGLMGNRLPGLKRYGWKDIGYLALDKTADVKNRRPKEIQQLILETRSQSQLTIWDSIAPLHYGSQFHPALQKSGELVFDPVIADASGQVAGLLPEVFGTPYPSIEGLGDKGKGIQNMLSKLHLKDVDDLLNQGKNKWSWLTPDV